MSVTMIPPITGISANINGNQYFSNQDFLGSDGSELLEVAWGEWLKDAKFDVTFVFDNDKELKSYKAELDTKSLKTVTQKLHLMN